MIFNPNRLAIARMRAMLTKKKLAESIGVAPLSLSRYENGKSQPTQDNVKSLSSILGFPVGFFYGDDIDIPSLETTSFRSLTSMSATIGKAALAAGSIAFTLYDWFNERFDFPDTDVPDFSGEAPHTAARNLRAFWGLGERPIGNMVHLLESKGIRVFSLAENTTKVNAYTLWRDDLPFVFLNTYMSPEKSRFDAAHELGHLVLHRDRQVTGREAEDEANAFASELLMPKSGVLANFRQVLGLPDLIRDKKLWLVSLMALNYRYHKLGLISDWKNRDLYIQATQNGYHKNEPSGISREVSQAWSKVLQMLWSEGVRLENIAEDLALPLSEIETLLFISNVCPPSVKANSRAFHVV